MIKRLSILAPSLPRSLAPSLPQTTSDWKEISFLMTWMSWPFFFPVASASCACLVSTGIQFCSVSVIYLSSSPLSAYAWPRARSGIVTRRRVVRTARHSFADCRYNCASHLLHHTSSSSPSERTKKFPAHVRGESFSFLLENEGPQASFHVKNILVLITNVAHKLGISSSCRSRSGSDLLLW